MTNQPAPKPIPEPDERSQAFFDGARRGEFMLSRCSDCHAWLPPASMICSECLGERIEWEQASGDGTVFSFGLMHQHYHPGFIQDLPYNVTVVELDEGPRFNTNLINISNDDIELGARVTVVFVEQGDGVFLPKFEPAD